MPCTAPLSTSLIEPPTIDATVWPALAVWSSVIEVTVDPMGVSTGASLTAVTVMLAVSVAVLNALLPPLVELSTLLPAAPLLWSQAR